MERLAIAILGGRHDYVPVVMAHLRRSGLIDEVDLVAVADEDDAPRALLERIAPQARSYRSARELLDAERIDIAVIGTSLADHARTIELCIERGVHTIVDKPMALDVEEAVRITNAARERGVYAMVDIPTAWSPGLWAAKRLVDDGTLGDIFYARYRSANMGPDKIGCDPLFTEWLFAPESGGVTFDYVNYGAVFASWFFGAPDGVIAAGGNLASPHLGPVDDNVSALIDYPSRIVLAEGSWTQIGTEPIDGPVILGTRGTVIVDYAVQHGEFGPESWRWVLKGVRLNLKGYSEWVDVPLPDLGEGMGSGIEHLVHLVRHGGELVEPVRPETHVVAQHIINGCLDALRTRQRVAIEAGAAVEAAR